MTKQKMKPKPSFKVIEKANVKINGFAAEYIPKDTKGKIIQKGLLTSQENRFYRLSESISDMFSFKNINNLLIIIDKENHAKIYIENFPLSMKSRFKRSVKKGEPIYKYDILDLSEVSFSDDNFNIDPIDGDRIIWIFRIGFVFGLYFDLTKKMNSATAKNEMAHLYQKVLYSDIYSSMESRVIKPLIENGWFPFIQLIGKGHESLLSFFEEGKTEHIASWSENLFSDDRIREIVSRWWTNEVFSKMKETIEEGIECFYEGKFTAAISTLIPMVEGITNNLSLIKTGKGVKYNSQEISRRIKEYSTIKFTDDSLTFPSLFTQYLNEYFFKHNKAAESSEAVRNTVSHGRATNQSFTKENAIKIILTLDQIFYYA